MKTIAQQIYDCMQNARAVRDGRADIQMEYCEQMERDCRANKSKLISVLRNHPNWDEDNLRVHFDKDYSRIANHHDAEVYLRTGLIRVSNYLWEKAVKDYSKDRNTKGCSFAIYSDEEYAALYDILKFYYIVRAMISYSKDYVTSSIADETVDFVRSNSNYTTILDGRCSEDLKVMEPRFRYEDAHIHKGAKGTKQVMKLLRQYGYEKLPEDVKHQFLQEYSKYADNMNPITITRHTILSVNPVDFLYMSNGNSWTSCHNIAEGGCYCAGCESYAYDQVSMILYTVDAEVSSENITTARKINRQMNFFNGDALLSVRVYPQSCDDDKGIYAECKTLVQEILATALGRPNLWKEADYKCYTYGLQYPDYTHFGPYKAYTLSDYSIKDRREANWCSHDVQIDNETGEVIGIAKSHLPIGSDDAICLCCGGDLTDEGLPICGDCGSLYVCEYCGDRIGGEVYWDGDYAYCEYCHDEHFSYCACCEGDYYEDRVSWIDSESGYICDDCLENDFTRCDNCGEYARNDSIEYVSGIGDVCNDCLNNSGDFFFCEECGEWKEYDEDEIVYVEGGGIVCKHCAETSGNYECRWFRV